MPKLNVCVCRCWCDQPAGKTNLIDLSAHTYKMCILAVSLLNGLQGEDDR